MPLTVQQATDRLTPYVQSVLIQNKTDFMDALNNYLNQKGFWGNIISSITQLFMSNFFWTFVLNTILPFIIKIVVYVLIDLFAQWLIPFEPFIDKLIDLIDQSLLSAQAKQTLKDLLALATVNPNLLPINTHLDQATLTELKSHCDCLEKYAITTTNSLFVEG